MALCCWATSGSTACKEVRTHASHACHADGRRADRCRLQPARVVVCMTLMHAALWECRGGAVHRLSARVWVRVMHACVHACMRACMRQGGEHQSVGVTQAEGRA
jgi:hypothetical protein